MYWARLADEAHIAPTIEAGPATPGRWAVPPRDDWRGEAPDDAYFSVAVWFSIGLVHAPVWKRATPA
jgi:hypothetical protein